MKGERSETDGKRDVSMVGRENENIRCFFSRTRALRPRTKFGVDLMKLTKPTYSDDIEAFMMTFERSMDAQEVEHIKWLVLLTPQSTGKAQQAYATLSSKDSKNFTKVKEAVLSIMIGMKTYS